MPLHILPAALAAMQHGGRRFLVEVVVGFWMRRFGGGVWEDADLRAGVDLGVRVDLGLGVGLVRAGEGDRDGAVDLGCSCEGVGVGAADVVSVAVGVAVAIAVVAAIAVAVVVGGLDGGVSVEARLTGGLGAG